MRNGKPCSGGRRLGGVKLNRKRWLERIGNATEIWESRFRLRQPVAAADPWLLRVGDECHQIVDDLLLDGGAALPQ